MSSESNDVSEAARIFDPVTHNIAGVNAVGLKVDGSGVTQPVKDVVIYGNYKYYAGASGTVVVLTNERVIGIGCHAATAGSFTIAGGASIPVPATTGVFITPYGNLVNPTIVFTGTDSYYVETVL